MHHPVSNLLFALMGMLVLNACSPAPEVPSEPVQPTKLELDGDIPYTRLAVPPQASIPSREKLVAVVNFEFGIRPIFDGDDFYFQVALRRGAEWISRDFHVPTSHLIDIPPNLAIQSLAAIEQRAVIPEMSELARLVAARSICPAGTVRDDLRESYTTAPFTPAESAQIQTAVGGNLSRLLGMSPEDLRRLGIDDIIQNRPRERRPQVGYTDIRFVDSAIVRLKCDL